MKNINLPLSLNNLSPDLKLVIATFLPAQKVFLHLTLVSKDFREMVKDYHEAKDIQSDLHYQRRETEKKTSQLKKSFEKDFQVAANKVDYHWNALTNFGAGVGIYFAAITTLLKNNEYQDYFYNGGAIVLVGILGVSAYFMGKESISIWSRCIKEHYAERELKSSTRFLTNLSKEQEL